jgi:hypothetical protein
LDKFDQHLSDITKLSPLTRTMMLSVAVPIFTISLTGTARAYS